MYIINMYGALDKRHLSIALGLEMAKFGSVSILTDNKYYTSMDAYSDTQLNYDGIDIYYVDNINTEIIEAVKNRYSVLIIDSLINLSIRGASTIEVVDDLTANIDENEGELVVEYSTVKRAESSIQIQPSENDKYVYLLSSLDSPSKREFISNTAAYVINVDTKEYLSAMKEGE